MKAFTVYQPYAHAIVAGVKHYETRPRRTHIRGRVAVHAGRLDEVQATKHLTNGEFWAVLEAAGGVVIAPDGRAFRYNQRPTLLNGDFLALGDPGLPWKSWL